MKTRTRGGFVLAVATYVRGPPSKGEATEAH